MTVTFIAHSAYLVEWDKFYTLFDYTYEPDYTGALPELNPEKPLLVFASHSHEDHFDAKVFTLLEKYPDARFFVSRDTRLTERKRQWLNISDEAFARTTVLRPDSILLTDVAGEDLSIRAIKSTDIGNAYLLRCERKMVYHGGDLNWWNWESEGKAYCNNMTVHYHAAIEKLASAVRNEATDNAIAPEITAAMAPLDPRLGEGSGNLRICNIQQIAVGYDQRFAALLVCFFAHPDKLLLRLSTGRQHVDGVFNLHRTQGIESAPYFYAKPL